MTGRKPRITGTRLVVVLVAGLVTLDMVVAPASRIEHGLAHVQAAAEEQRLALEEEREQREAERAQQAEERRRTVVSAEEHAAAAEASGTTAPVTVELPADPAGATIDMINATRAAAGEPPLERHRGIDDVAQRWSEHMASRDEQYHNPDYPAQIAAVFDGLRGTAENVAHGRPGDLERIHQSFVDSPGHYRNMVGDFTHVGVGVALTADGTVWVTHNFARR
jgi:uncharacterized protein YkwD